MGSADTSGAKNLYNVKTLPSNLLYCPGTTINRPVVLQASIFNPEGLSRAFFRRAGKPGEYTF